ncbi:histidine phosphatase family protein [Streptomyces sp. NPDC050164]|uniref:histidine phosphatase family protein n=1 Tax=Streptomyces sp. NPDC050164 TaxID=3365605 RepID=UPI00378CA961
MSDVEREAIRTRWAPYAGPPSRLPLARHGATEYSQAGRFSGHNELPLDATGALPATAPARHLREYGPVQTIISAPLRRARETAAACRRGRRRSGRAWRARDGLRFQGGIDVRRGDGRWPEALTGWPNAEDAAPPGGEPFASLPERIARAVAGSSMAAPVNGWWLCRKDLLRRALGTPHDEVFRFHAHTGSLSILDSYVGGAFYGRMLNRSGPACHRQESGYQVRKDRAEMRQKNG